MAATAGSAMTISDARMEEMLFEAKVKVLRKAEARRSAAREGNVEYVRRRLARERAKELAYLAKLRGGMDWNPKW